MPIKNKKNDDDNCEKIKEKIQKKYLLKKYY